jgi:hypothetical protein
MKTATAISEHTRIEFFEGDCCPVHENAHKKTYHFGSSMSAETDVCVFRGCGCAVAIRHDPIGTLKSTATYHETYGNASGVGRLHAMEAAAKYR